MELAETAHLGGLMAPPSPTSRVAPVVSQPGSRGGDPHRDEVLMPADELPIDPDLDEDRRVTGQGRARPDVIAAIAIGGSLGTLARAGLGVAFPTVAGHLPWTTLVINVVGSFLLGLALAVIVERLGPSRYPRPLVATGFLGGFTTFSTFMVDAAQLGRTGHVPIAIAYVVMSIIGGFGAAWLGIVVARPKATA
jgi:CrcB protein